MHLLRGIARRPGIAVTIVATLALGVGVATALFLYLDSFLHPRLAVPDSERVAWVTFGSADDPLQRLSFLELERLRAQPLLAAAVGTSPLRAAPGRSTQTLR